ncbi:MAG: sensor histidine kinase [Bacteroidales bacterium]|nr:sensor histidine kinase [Bacteroidales bacterium]MBR6161380.1 sensor histidine kinase [Bacteroidales bacterium]
MKDLSMHIMDILQNSTRAKASTITLEVLLDSQADTLTLIFKDDGCGMSPEMVEKVTNPFFTTRTTRKVGLGLPLLKQNTEMTGGSMDIQSEVGVGTTVTAVFGLTHLDTPPMGDLAGTIVLTISAHPEIHFIFHYKRDEEIDYTLDTDEVYEVLDGMPINDPDVIASLKEMVEENIR